MNYQGKLTTTLTHLWQWFYDMEFKLYTCLGGSPIWTETLTAEISPSNKWPLQSASRIGFFIGCNFDFNQTLYLGVNISNDGEMTPRKKLGACPQHSWPILSMDSTVYNSFAQMQKCFFGIFRSDNNDSIDSSYASTTGDKLLPEMHTSEIDDYQSYWINAMSPCRYGWSLTATAGNCGSGRIRRRNLGQRQHRSSRASRQLFKYNTDIIASGQTPRQQLHSGLNPNTQTDDTRWTYFNFKSSSYRFITLQTLTGRNRHNECDLLDSFYKHIESRTQQFSKYCFNHTSTSTFAGGVAITGGCITVNGACLGGTSYGEVMWLYI